MCVAVGPALFAGALTAADGGGVQIVVKESDRRVDVLVDGQPFTSYVWPTTLKKPVLYPIRTAKGTLVTRGFPLDPRPGERVDHPHHVGLWFNYGNVDGYDFWNNSDAIEPQNRGKMGTILHRAIAVAKSGAEEGVLETDSDWVAPDGTVLLKERTRYVFRGTPSSRTIDRITTLTALGKRVPMPDNKEGVLGLRVTRALEHPSDKPEVFTDAAGRPTPVAKLDNTGVTGRYLTSEGKIGDAAWGTRGRWCVLSGTIGTEPVAIAILDHPSQPWTSDVLARARLWTVRCQSTRPERFERRQGRLELRHRRKSERDVPPSHRNHERRLDSSRHRGRVETVGGTEVSAKCQVLSAKC